METSKLINGDCLEELKKLDEDSVDLLCTDPPYGYGFMGKHWDTFQEKQSTKSQKVGWMSPGMTKSTYGMKEFFVPIWEEALRVLKPGGFAFVMSAPRSDVQTVMVQTLQEAGFDVSFTPIYWAYATGFPKAMNIGKAVTKRGDIDEAKKLDGSYAGYQPKPAVEVVIVAMKPLDQKGYVDQALHNGKGITWLDSCRIPFAGMNDEDEEHYKKAKGDKENYSKERGWDKWGEEETYERVSAFGDPDQSETKDGRNLWGKKATKKVKITKRQPRSDHNVFKQSGFKSEENDTAEASPLGRFAANLLVSDDVLNDGKSRKTGNLTPYMNNRDNVNTYGEYKGVINVNHVGDEGSFSRYYSLDEWWKFRMSRLPEEIQRTFPFLVVPKASKSEKNAGCDGLPKGPPPGSGRRKPAKGRSSALGEPRSNHHPTVKPIDLMSYLVVLGSRKNDVVLDPFSGSGTTGIACVFSERNYILIEREKEYFKIMEARIKKAENPAGLVQHEWF